MGPNEINNFPVPSAPSQVTGANQQPQIANTGFAEQLPLQGSVSSVSIPTNPLLAPLQPSMNPLGQNTKNPSMTQHDVSQMSGDRADDLAWVQKAKDVISQNQLDPKMQADALIQLREIFLKERFHRDVTSEQS